MIGAILLLFGPTPDTRRLGLEIVGCSVHADYMPSILSMAFYSHKLRQKTTLPRVLTEAKKRFQAYMATSQDALRDPDALTLSGLMALSSGDDAGAIRRLESAVKAGASMMAPKQQQSQVNGPGPYRWNWEPSCLLTLGRVYARKGREQDAIKILQAAALECDMPEAYYELAVLLPKTNPDRFTYVTKAAISGNSKAMELLAEHELVQAEMAMDVETSETHARLAEEWQKISQEFTEQPGSRLA